MEEFELNLPDSNLAPTPICSIGYLESRGTKSVPVLLR